MYTGKQTEIDQNKAIGISGSVVNKLLEPYFGKGHSLYVDNWYSSPQLFQFLHANKVGACGTVKANRKFLPKFDNLQVGERKHFHSNNIMALNWRDKRTVHMVTSLHEDRMVETEKVNRTTGEKIKKTGSDC